MGRRWPGAFLGGVRDWFAEVFDCGCCCTNPSSKDAVPPPLGSNAAIFSQPESSSSSDADEAQAFVEIDVLRPDLNAKRHYPSNSIRTATYTFFSSIPLSLLYQFRKVSNLYFLLVMIISLVPGASPINPFSSIAPLCIVLGAGVVKDLWEDWRRRRADSVANNQEVSVLRDGVFTTVKSRSVQPGDVMLIRLGEEVKADSLIVNTSLADGLTYIETANLDGETNAKTRRAKLQTVERLGTVEDIMELALGKSAVPANRNAAASAVALARLPTQVGSCSSPSTTPQRSHELVEVKNKVPTPSMCRSDESTHMCPVPTSPTAAPPRLHQQECMTSVSSPSAGEAIVHRRFCTLDERMELEGAFPVPRAIVGMSRQYEAQHSHSISSVLDTLPSGKVAPGVGATGRGSAPGDPGCGCGCGTDSSTAFEHPQSHVGLPKPSGTAADAGSPGKSGVVVLGSLPSPDLATWFGQLRLPTGELVPLGVEQFLPRGCIIRNTDWVLGIVVYTGRHTKMQLNLRPRPSKTPVMLRRLHRLNIFLFIVNQIAILVLCGLAIRFKHRMLRKEPGVKSGYSAWYIQWNLERDTDAQLFGWCYLTNFVLLSSLIPISLYVTLEFNKAMQMLLIGADKRMAVFDEFRGELRYTRPKTSELNCQLGLVQYIFTDKTGTLTENLMTYVGGYVGGIVHDERARPGDLGCRLLRSFGGKPRSNHSITGSRSWFPVEEVDRGSGSDRPPVGVCPQVDVVDVAPTATGRFVGAANVRGASAGTAPCRDPPPSMVTIDGQQLDESRLEEDKVFRYLRCLALCHCVVCFDVPTSGGDTADAHPSPGKDRRKRQERRRHRAQPKAKTNTHRGTGGRWSPSWPAATPLHTPDAATVVHHRFGSSARPTIFVANAVPAAPADRTTVPEGDGGGRGWGRPADSAHRVVEGPRAREDVVVHPRFTPVLSFDYSEAPRDTPLGMGAGGSRVDVTLPVFLDRLPVSPPPEDHPRRTRTMSLSRTLHGRTGSASWYSHRYTANVLHQRSLTMGNTANPLESHVDRSKIYEGQSLDEIAFVSAARENGFSLVRRTAKQICVLVLGHVMCFNIIAELEFTPQRKLMSILLERNPAGDTMESATQVLGTAHYHRHDGGGGTLESPSNKLLEGGQPVEDPSSPRPPHPQAARQPAEPETQRWETAGTSPLARDTTCALMGGSGDPHRRPSPPPTAVPATAAPGQSSFLLLVKGADSSMFDIINPANGCNAEMKIACQHHITAMASNGLRTLMLGQKYLTEKEVCEWLPIYQQAQCVVDQRSERLHEAYALLEKDIDLIGATAVEDKLQDGVPETLKFFTEASIVVWMLTGDKRETAVTIAHTSGLVDPEYPEEVYHLDLSDLMMEAAHRRPAVAGDGLRPKEPTTYMVDECTGEPYPVEERDLTEEIARAADAQLAAVEARCASWETLTKDDASLPARAVVLVVDGKTLDFLFDSNAYASRFFALGVRCRSAVCCRMTPLHKAQTVSMFQKNTKAVTLAVGDGANDVTMLQESRIGVGIMGLEGSQAELASDFAIPKFRFLKRLLMVHGRFSIYREANCILFSMYKNVAITGVQFGYSFYCGYSGQTFVDSWLLAMLATFFCSLQPLMIGIFDKDVEDELAEAVPSLYAPLSREETYFSIGDIAKWLSDGLIEGLTFFILLMNTTALNEDLYAFRMGGIEDYGQTVFTMMVLVVNLRAGTMVTYYMILLVVTILIELAAIPIFEIVYSALHELAGSNWSVYTAHAMYRSGKLYLLLFFAVGVMIVYSLATYLYVEMFVPRRSAKRAMKAARVSPYRDTHRAKKRKLMEEYHSALGRSVGAGRRGGHPRGRDHNSQP